ncbi:MAG TPA: hypothetical protein VH353_08660 [Caulobacteraceae bacterium]|nr:hypothetical protein [Caulobacteraceae bacterium]
MNAHQGHQRHQGHQEHQGYQGPWGSTDPLYDKPFVDLDEQRDQPVPHRYVHGGFADTDLRFSIYFPPPERYEGRFFQPLMAVSGTEHAATLPPMMGAMIGHMIPFAFDSGAYLVESNQGRTVMYPGEDPTIPGYRASAATVRYSRALAAEMYGAHRPYGYVFGGSGGAYKTIACFENTLGVWDGAVPFVMGSPASMPNVFTVQAHAMRVLWDKFPQIIDALEPGGGGDMYAGLNREEREALAEVTRMGFPPQAWFAYRQIATGYTGVFGSLVDNMVKWDPGYFEAFWTTPGYLGFDAPESLRRARLQHDAKISRIVWSKEAIELGLPVSMSAKFADNEAESPAAIQVEQMPNGAVQGATLTMTTGAAAGHSVLISGVVRDMVLLSFGEAHFQAMAQIRTGDEVRMDNSIYLATQTYHRHQIPPGGDFPVWDQFKAAGQPIYPQRPYLMGPRYALGGTGTLQTGRFAGKMIVVEAMLDEAAYPWQADWYRMQVRRALGERLDDQFRLWFVDRAMHTGPFPSRSEPRPARTTRVVPYVGVLQQALRDVSAWVEQGLPPPASTEYDIVDGQVRVPARAATRKGVQLVVALRANDGERAEVMVGEAVSFEARIDVPAGTGIVVAADWDFEGAGDFPVSEPLEFLSPDGSSVAVKASYAFAAPGVYFPALRAVSHRHGNAKTRFARVQNLGRVRVVVR